MTMPRVLRRARRWLRQKRYRYFGPARAQLRVKVAQLEDERRKVQALLKAERKTRHEATNRIMQLESQVTRLNQRLIVQTEEPPRSEGCAKIRFHRIAEAAELLERLCQETGQKMDAFTVYGCKVCPRSPFTHRRYVHIGHGNSEQAQQQKAEAVAARRGAHRRAERGGMLLSQRVDPTVLAKLKKITREDVAP